MILVATCCAVGAAVLPSHRTRTVVATVTVYEEAWMPIIQPDHWAILTIIGEAASEPYMGQVAVGNVIRNRMARKYSSDGTIIGTVLRPKQFSMWDDRARIYAARIELDSDVYMAAVDAWNYSKYTDPTKGAVLYHTGAVHPRWADAPSVSLARKIGAHLFYHDSGGA